MLFISKASWLLTLFIQIWQLVKATTPVCNLSYAVQVTDIQIAPALNQYPQQLPFNASRAIEISWRDNVTGAIVNSSTITPITNLRMAFVQSYLLDEIVYATEMPGVQARELGPASAAVGPFGDLRAVKAVEITWTGVPLKFNNSISPILIKNVSDAYLPAIMMNEISYSTTLFNRVQVSEVNATSAIGPFAQPQGPPAVKAVEISWIDLFNNTPSISLPTRIANASMAFENAYVQNDIIYSTNIVNNNVVCPTTTIAVAPTTKPELPRILAITNGPSQLSSCDDPRYPLSIDSSSSVGTGLTYYYYYYGAVDKVLSVLRSYNNTPASAIYIPTSIIPVGTTLTIGITVKDLYGQTSSTSFTTTKSPGITPTLRIVEGTLLQIAYSDYASLTPVVDVPSCSNSTIPAFTFIWTSVTPMGNKTYPRTLLNVPGSVLGYGKSLFIVTATSSSTVLVQSISVEVRASPLVVSIDGGSVRQVSVEDPLFLRALVIDSDKPGQLLYSYNWSCQTTATRGCLSTFPNAGVVSIYNGSTDIVNGLIAEQTYRYTLVVSDTLLAGRTASFIATVYTVAGMPPAITLARNPGDQVISGDTDMTIYSTTMLRSLVLSPKLATYKWSLTAAGLPVTLPSTVNTNSTFLVLRANLLQPSTLYTARINVTYQNAQGFSDISFTTSSPPMYGWVQLVNLLDSNQINGSAASGYAFTDTFRISSANWTTNYAYPLLYTLGFIHDTGAKTYFTYQSSVSTMSGVRLPITARIAFAEVSDIYNNIVRVTQPVNIVQKNLSTTESTQLQNDLLAAINTTTNVADVLNNLDTLLSFTSTSNTSSTPSTTDAVAAAARLEVVQQQTANVLLRAFESSEAVTSKTSVQTINLLSGMNTKTTSSGTISKLFDVFEKMISGSTVSGGAATSMSVTTAAQAATFASNVRLSASVSTSVSASTRANKLGPLRKRQSTTDNSTAALSLRVRTSVFSIARSMVAGDSCSVPTTPKVVSTASFSLQAHRIAANESISADATSIQNFTLALPTNLPTDCLDTQYIVWADMNGNTLPGSLIVTNVLSVQVSQNGSNVSISSGSQKVAFNSSVTATSYTSNHTIAQCARFVNSAWTASGCDTIILNNTQVSCNCTLNGGDYAVQMASQQSTTTAASTATSTPATTAASTGLGTGGTVGVAVGCVAVGVGSLVGFSYYRKKKLNNSGPTV